MAQVPTGTTFYVATAYAAAIAATAISNAVEAVVSAAGHAYGVGDFIEVTSGWGRLNRRVFRVKSVVAGVSFVLEKADTTNNNFFPPGGGVGTVRKITAFTQVTGVMSPSSSGGEPKKVVYKYIEADVEYSINDGFTATDYSIDVDADMIGTPGYEAMKQLTDVQTDTCLKMVMRSGSVMVLPCTIALNESVSFQDGQINKVKAQFSGNNRLMRYAA